MRRQRTSETTRHRLRRILPNRVLLFYRAFFGSPARHFLLSNEFALPFSERLKLLSQFYTISANVDCPHSQEEILSVVTAILAISDSITGCLVEAGCYKGGSTAKLSLAAKIASRKLLVFDSFQGIPETHEPHSKDIYGGPASFKRGDYLGALDEVKTNLSSYGSLDSCELIAGWFEETMPNFREPIAVVFLDVDLASSTRTCLKYLYPLLTPGGVLYSHDGHLPLVIDVFNDDEFWASEVGCRKPHIEGLGERKLIKVVKE